MDLKYPLSSFRAGLYIRLSKEDKNAGESESIQNQRKLLLKFTEENKIEVKGIYSDDGFSGTGFDRPDFKRLISDIENKKINLVITKDLSRLGRDYIMTGYYIEKFFPLHNVRYISLLDGIDTGEETALNEITPFKAILNDMYASDISKKIKSVKHNKQQRGEFIGGKAPYGYILEKNRLYIDEEAAEVVRKIFSLCLEGKTYCEIARILDSNLIPCPSVYANLKGCTGKLWNGQKISDILKSEIYKGSMVQGKRRKINYKIKKCVAVAEENWIKVSDTHEGIIDDETFYKVQEILKRKKPLRKRKYEHILKGLVCCKDCNEPMSLLNRKNSKGEDVLYFYCRRCQKAGLPCKMIKAESIEAPLKEKLASFLESSLSDSEIFSLAKDYLSKEGRDNQLLKNKEAELADIKIKTERLCNKMLDNSIEEEDFKALYKKFTDKKKLLEAKIKEIGKSVKAFDDEEILKLVKSFKSQIFLSKAFLLASVDKIEIDKSKNINVYFAFKEPSDLQ